MFACIIYFNKSVKYLARHHLLVKVASEHILWEYLQEKSPAPDQEQFLILTTLKYLLTIYQRSQWLLILISNVQKRNKSSKHCIEVSKKKKSLSCSKDYCQKIKWEKLHNLLIYFQKVVRYVSFETLSDILSKTSSAMENIIKSCLVFILEYIIKITKPCKQYRPHICSL